MSNYKRLILKVSLSEEQIKASRFLMDGFGLCTCGRLLSQTDAKLLLGNIGPADAKDPERRNTLTIGAYCWDCASRINSSMKNCKDAAYRQGRSEAELRG